MNCFHCIFLSKKFIIHYYIFYQNMSGSGFVTFLKEKVFKQNQKSFLKHSVIHNFPIADTSTMFLTLEMGPT